MNIIDSIKKSIPNVYVIGTNEDENSVIKTVCDEWYKEPIISDSNKYVDYCIDFCLQHNVNLFMPRRYMTEISYNKKRFIENNIKVMVDEYEMVSILNDKGLSYAFFQSNGIDIIPDYYIVETVSDFLDAYRDLNNKYSQVCFKFIKDEGGKSFRLIDNNRKGYKALFKKQNTRMVLEDVIEALSECKKFAPIMIMPYLSGDEISVDCLKTDQGLIALPRIKGLNKYETLSYDKKIISLCEEFQKITKLSTPYNIQFKYLDNHLYFLEINTRMSGGIHMSCLASGVNIPGIAVRKIMGMEYDWKIKDIGKVKVSQTLNPVILP